MSRTPGWTRREFVRQAGLLSVAAAAAAHPLEAAGPGRLVQGDALRSPLPPPLRTGLAYVGSSGGHLAVFVSGRHAWRKVQEIPTPQPSCLVLNPEKDVLYVVNGIDLLDHLPTGSVEAYRIGSDGRLSLLDRRPLSLSAIRPGHAAITPDGTALAVAVDGGGAYNLLPIRSDGGLERVSLILKETGSGPVRDHQGAARPQMILFDTRGHLVSADMGSDRLNILRLATDRFEVLDRRPTDAGSGPWQLELHPAGELLFVLNALEPSLVSYRYDGRGGRILEPLDRVILNPSAEGAKTPPVMAMRPAGDLLYTASGRALTAWRIQAGEGRLAPAHQESAGDSLSRLMVTADGGSLLALSRQAGTVTRWQVDGEGRPRSPVRTATISLPLSMTLRCV